MFDTNLATAFQNLFATSSTPRSTQSSDQDRFLFQLVVPELTVLQALDIDELLISRGLSSVITPHLRQASRLIFSTKIVV